MECCGKASETEKSKETFKVTRDERQIICEKIMVLLVTADFSSARKDGWKQERNSFKALKGGKKLSTRNSTFCYIIIQE